MSTHDNSNDNKNDNGIGVNMHNTYANLDMNIDLEVANRKSNLQLQASSSQLLNKNKNSDIDIDIDMSMGDIQVVNNKPDLKLQSSSSQLSKNEKNIIPSKQESAMSNAQQQVQQRPQRSVTFVWKLNTMSYGKYEDDGEVPIRETVDGSSTVYKDVHKHLNDREYATLERKKRVYKVDKKQSISIVPASGR